MKDFILEHIELFIMIGCSFVELILLILCCVLKRKKSDPIYEDIVARIPLIINEAEKRFGAGNGHVKKDFVLSTCLMLYKQFSGVNVDSSSLVYKLFSDAIELVLSTPQKKG